MFAGLTLRDGPVSSPVYLESRARVDDVERARGVMGKREVRYSRQTRETTGHESGDGPNVLDNQIEK